MRIFKKILNSIKVNNLITIVLLHTILKRNNTRITSVPYYIHLMVFLRIKYVKISMDDIAYGIEGDIDEQSDHKVITHIKYSKTAIAILKKLNQYDTFNFHIVIPKEKYDMVSNMKCKFYISHGMSNNNTSMIIENKKYTKLKLMGFFDS